MLQMSLTLLYETLNQSLILYLWFVPHYQKTEMLHLSICQRQIRLQNLNLKQCYCVIHLAFGILQLKTKTCVCKYLYVPNGDLVVELLFPWLNAMFHSENPNFGGGKNIFIDVDGRAN